MSGYCPDCGNALCVCSELDHEQIMPSITDEYERLQKLLVDSIDENENLKKLIKRSIWHIECLYEEVIDCSEVCPEDDVEHIDFLSELRGAII